MTNHTLHGCGFLTGLFLVQAVVMDPFSPLPAQAQSQSQSQSQACISADASRAIRQRLGEMGTSAFLLSTGLQVCSVSLGEGERQAIQQLAELQAQADRETETLVCPAAGARDPRTLVPLEAHATEQRCSCEKYRNALATANRIIANLQE